MKVLLSIKPEFVEKIFSGDKKFEFRKAIFKDPGVKTIVIYASSPVKKAVGEFEVDEIIYEDIEKLWDRTKHHAGISLEYFNTYFDKREAGFAIRIKNVKKYKNPVCIMDVYNAVPPQSFAYIH